MNAAALFWLCAVALVAMAAAAVLVPLWRGGKTPAADRPEPRLNTALFRERLAELERDYAAERLTEAQHLELRTELERNLLAEEDAGAQPPRPPKSTAAMTALGVAAALLLPLAGLGYYYFSDQRSAAADWLNTVERYRAPVVSARQTPRQPPGLTGEELFDFTRVLAAEVARDGMREAGDLYLLGNSLLQLEAPRQALDILRRGYHLEPQDTALTLAYAQARVLNNQGRLDGESATLLRQVLSHQPHHQGALMLLGFAARNAGDDAVALSAWRPLLATLAPDSEPARLLRQSIRDAEQRLAAAVSKTPDTEPADGGPQIRVTVDLAPELRAGLAADASLFVFARAADGPPMPLAAVRRPADDFPVEITLDDSRSMLPSLKLSGFDTVLVGARVSAGGGPLARPGDLEAAPQTLQLNATPGPSAVSLTIDRVVQ